MRVILIAGLLCCGGSALANPVDANGGLPRSRTIQTADLDLSRPAGVTELRRRMRLALDDVCGMLIGSSSDATLPIMRCRAQARAAAQPAMAALIARAEGVQTAARR